MNEPLTQGPYQATTPVAYIAHESEEMVHVRRAELRYWATEALEVVKNPLEGAGAWATTCAGISVAAGLSALGLLATEDKTHKVPSGVYLVMLSVTLAFGVAAAFCWWVDRKQREMRTSRAESLADQIKAADTRSPRDPDAQPTSALVRGSMRAAPTSASLRVNLKRSWRDLRSNTTASP